MSKEIEEPKPLEEPQEVVNPEGGAFYERYKKDGVYEYAKLPDGKNDKSHVKITYNNGTIYEGRISLGRYAGTGKYVWQDAAFYEGDFQRGKLRGNGKYTAANGDRYEGQFKGNRYNGSGTYTWSDGSKFEGLFKAGRISEGRYTDSSGNIYFCSYTYKINGERKSGEIRLIKATNTQQSESQIVTTENPQQKNSAGAASKKERLEKSGLLNRDLTLMTAIRKSVRGADFKELYNGKVERDERNEKRLMAILNFFTNSNSEQMQRIYMSSKLYNPEKGQMHVSDLVDRTVKNGQEFSRAMKTKMKGKAKNDEAGKGAVK